MRNKISTSPKIRTNKLNIYLLKETIKNEEDAIKNLSDPDLKVVKIKNVGSIYYSKAYIYKPDWLEKFFRNDPLLNSADFNNANAKAVLILKVKYHSKNVFFAIPFGFGRFLLRDDSYVERFGLKTTLNLLDHASIRGIGKKTLSGNPKLSVEQISKETEVSDFDINIEKDIVSSITGRSQNIDFGKMLTGKDALHVSSKTDYTNIKVFLIKCLDQYNNDRYKDKFGWIDFISEVKNRLTVEILNKELVKKIKARSADVWLSVPDIIDWQDFKGFTYSNNQSEHPSQDLNIQDFISEIGDITSISIETLENNYVYCWKDSNSHFSHRWSIFKCLNGELKTVNRKTKEVEGYLLDNGKWYAIDENFINHVNEIIDAIPQCKIALPGYNHKSEADYNIYASKAIGGLCVDKSLLSYGRGHSKIEICDILYQKNLFFIKRYSSSATMSHLFAQGFVSAELLLFDVEFRQAVNNILPTRYRKYIPIHTKFKATNYTLTYVIIGKREKQHLPFFSKVSLKDYYLRLTNYGYNVDVANIS